MPQTIMMIGANDPNIGYLLNRYAQETGFQTSSVSQEQDILDLANHLHPTLILLDIGFVETKDWEFLHRLKADPAVRDIPIIVCSCLGEPPENWHEGKDGFLLKSAMYDDFVAVLEQAGLYHCGTAV
jgi:CheY-like chemotaxis protein